MASPATTPAVKRKYALTKIAPGDYILPSNDAQTIWRLVRYTDGPSNGLEIPRDRDFWGVWRWKLPVGNGGYVDTADWDRWEHVAGACETRADAIREALRMTGRER